MGVLMIVAGDATKGVRYPTLKGGITLRFAPAFLSHGAVNQAEGLSHPPYLVA